MGWWIAPIAVVGIVVLGWLAQRAGLIDLRPTTKRGGGVAGLVGGIDEFFAPTRHEAQLELERQTELPAPAPLPGDGDKGVYGGRLRIELDDDDGPASGSDD